ncbi:heavy metal translocatin, partial [Suillus brevipes Sb2]
YFDSVSMIITFVLIGKFLEVLSKKKAADTLDSITKQIPSEVNILEDEKIISCPIANVKVGDIIVISSGEKVLFDGEIIKGEGSFDESSLTGESDPIYKNKSANIIGGTLSIDANIHYKATKDFEHSTLASLVTLLESAMNKKPKIEQLANKLSEYFSSIILVVACITFLTWLLWPHSFEVSFMVGISVIIIACPCALALATPVATLVGLGLGATRGILFKEAAQLETMAKIDTLVVDKTGTLTLGEPEVLHETVCKEFDRNLLYSLVKSSKHPVSKGIVKYLLQEEVVEYMLDTYKQVPALGIEASYAEKSLLGGNEQLLKKNAISFGYDSDKTLFYFCIENEVVAVYELGDTIKNKAKEIIGDVYSLGIEVVMLTGDNDKVASSVANEIGIQEYKSELSPAGKADYINMLHKNGKKVVMVGDGVNDILALAQADIGIAMGSGSDIAIDVGDIVLLNNSLESLGEAFKIANTTYSLIKQNLGISLVYNVITIPLAMAGYIIPFIAAIAMSASSLFVVVNSMRIRHKWNKG